MHPRDGFSGAPCGRDKPRPRKQQADLSESRNGEAIPGSDDLVVPGGPDPLFPGRQQGRPDPLEPHRIGWIGAKLQHRAAMLEKVPRSVTPNVPAAYSPSPGPSASVSCGSPGVELALFAVAVRIKR